ncbi:aminopeptidase N [Thaumasiovibrio subtropicus]|uniref:aminopeptidase N n=1 Tax=Thaumasiovibrio subtropicus TaxID=1891207 RepID=UPI000B358F4A|nr:aminopeptidase N [Thaumasiovibrio subtropicus]
MADKPTAKYRKDYKPADFSITHVHLTFDLQETDTHVRAVNKVVRQSHSEASTLVLAGEDLDLVALAVNGVAHTDYALTEGGIEIHQVPAEFELTVDTKINPKENSSLEGLYLSEGAFCTQCEAEGFRRITFYLDRPDNLAIFTTKVIADTSFPSLLSNGNRVAAGEVENGRHWVEWHDPFPKPSYLFALVAGDFDILEDTFTTKSGREVALEIYVDKGNLDRSHHAMLSLKRSMQWDEERFGLEYDLDIYMIVAVDFFNMGAMENKGLNVFNSKFVLAKPETATDADFLGIEAVIGHEYFHNWTGNRITCRDWFQLSLKEGLTVFRDQEFSSDLGSRAVNRINNVRIVRGPQFAEDAGPMAHPIRPEKVIEMNNFYTLTVYEKGSEVIRMLHTLLGEEKFQAGMRLYVDRHDGTAATCEDFVVAMEEASGADLKQFRLWYSQSGTPELTVATDYDATAKTFSVTVSQETKPTLDQAEKQALHIPFDIELYGADGRVLPLILNGGSVDNVLNVTQATQTFVFENIEEKPVISMLREFSAPVKLHYDYTDEELSFLMVNATNDFARWDAGQMLLAKHIRHNVTLSQQENIFELPLAVIAAFEGVLTNAELEPAFVAEMLTLPTESEVAGWYDVADVDAIANALGFIRQTLASEMVEPLTEKYHQLLQADYDVEHTSINKRKLRNTCLRFLALTEAGDELVKAQYRSSNNMTDTIAALDAANTGKLPCRETLMADFSDKWQHDGLVMDKWFMLQGKNPAENALDVVKAQLSHPAFNIKNPNRCRNLIGSFCGQNPLRFHARSGEGYEFLVDMLTQLNSVNPQVASRLIDPLLKFKRYDEARQRLMRSGLEKLAKLDGLAKDLFEKINKALEQ